MKKFYAVLTRISSAVSVVSFAGVIAATLLTCADVFLRKLFNRSIFGAYELMEMIMACTVFASFAYTQTQKGHIRVSMFIKKMPRRLGMVLYAINELLCTAIAGAITYSAYLQIGYAMKKHLVSANLFIPIYPFYGVEMLCMGIFALVLLTDAVMCIAGIFKAELAEEIMASI